MVFAHSGNCAKQFATWITPMPRATDKPTTAVFLVLSPSFRSVYKELHADRETGC